MAAPLCGQADEGQRKPEAITHALSGTFRSCTISRLPPFKTDFQRLRQKYKHKSIQLTYCIAAVCC
jgi:hypothetical protein